MLQHPRIRYWLFGALFGAWLGFIYAVTTQVINALFLPGIPLMPPTGSLTGYLAQYIFMGAVLGLISSIPSSGGAGMLLGAFVTMVLFSFLILRQGWGGETTSSLFVLVLCVFVPMMIMMIPVAYFIRAGVDAQDVDPLQPHLWGRRILIPLVLTLVVTIIGSLSLHDEPSRRAFRLTHEVIQEGQRAASEEALPVPLEGVKGFFTDAKGPYQLEWSDRIDTYFGPIPVGAELSQFLIIARFENGFSMACIYSGNRSVPSCTNY